jgi:hypothetical protein
MPKAPPAGSTQQPGRPADLVVISPLKDWTCAGCNAASATGDFLIMADVGPLCLTCADMDHLIFLRSGDAALTRRAKQASKLSAVVVRWSRSRKRYQRQGIPREDARDRVRPVIDQVLDTWAS